MYGCIGATVLNTIFAAAKYTRARARALPLSQRAGRSTRLANLMPLLTCKTPMTHTFDGVFRFAPVGLFIKWRENVLITTKSKSWADSVAESKMFFVYCAVHMFLVASCAMLGVVSGIKLAAAVFTYLLVTARLYEEIVAAARSCYSLLKLMVLPRATMQEMQDGRRAASATVAMHEGSLPESAKGVARRALEAESNGGRLAWYSMRWFEWPWYSTLISLVLRRRKQDWNEILRLRDHGTMDYIN